MCLLHYLPVFESFYMTLFYNCPYTDHTAQKVKKSFMENFTFCAVLISLTVAHLLAMD